MKIKNLLAVLAIGLCSTAWIACAVDDPSVDTSADDDESAADADEATGTTAEAITGKLLLWECRDTGKPIRRYEGRPECENACVKACTKVYVSAPN